MHCYQVSTSASEPGTLIVLKCPYPWRVEEPSIYESVRVHTAIQTGRTENDLVPNAPSVWHLLHTSVSSWYQYISKCFHVGPRSKLLSIKSELSTNTKHVFSAGHKGRLSGETGSICEGKRRGSVCLKLFSVVQSDSFRNKPKIHPLWNLPAELETEVVHTQQIWAQILQRQNGESLYNLGTWFAEYANTSQLHFYIWWHFVCLCCRVRSPFGAWTWGPALQSSSTTLRTESTVSGKLWPGCTVYLGI